MDIYHITVVVMGGGGGGGGGPQLTEKREIQVS